jgi:hypothetical protein
MAVHASGASDSSVIDRDRHGFLDGDVDGDIELQDLGASPSSSTIRSLDKRERSQALWRFLRKRMLPHEPLQYQERTRAVFAFLYKGYREQLWWWEVTVVARKVIFVFVTVFFATSTAMQLQLMMMTALVSMYLQVTYNPWETEDLNWLEKWSSICVLGAMNFSVILQLEGLGQFGKIVSSFFILIFLWGFIGLFAVFIAKEIRIMVAQKLGNTESDIEVSEVSSSKLQNQIILFTRDYDSQEVE